MAEMAPCLRGQAGPPAWIQRRMPHPCPKLSHLDASLQESSPTAPNYRGNHTSCPAHTTTTTTPSFCPRIRSCLALALLPMQTPSLRATLALAAHEIALGDPTSKEQHLPQTCSCPLHQFSVTS